MSQSAPLSSDSMERSQLNQLKAHIRKLFRSKKRQNRNRIANLYTIRSKDQDTPAAVIKVVEVPASSSLINTPPFEITPPRHQKAFIVAQKGQYELIDNYQFPSLENDDEVMIKNYAVGLNPIDWKSVTYNFCLPAFPWITGREMSGIVEKVGNNVTTVKVGDRVWTSTYYRDVRAGCFQEYVVVPKHTVLPIPGDMSFEEAACLGVPALTAAMTLWKWLQIPAPRLKWVKAQERVDSVYPDSQISTVLGTVGEFEAGQEWLLIWGGGTSTGQFATQIARLSGRNVITICSSKTANLSKSLGATHVVIRDNRDDSELLEEISNVTQGHITQAIDLVGPKTAAHCLKACSTDAQLNKLGPRNVIFAPLAMMSTTQDVPSNVTVETVEMKRFVLDVNAGVYGEKLNDLIKSGSLKLPELEVLTGGLGAIEAGLEMVKKGNMGGKKIIVKM